MYNSLTKTKKYSELKVHETLKRVASANAILEHYKSSSLITVKRHAMVLSFFKSITLLMIYLVSMCHEHCKTKVNTYLNMTYRQTNTQVVAIQGCPEISLHTFFRYKFIITQRKTYLHCL